jgi:membrane fusion protein (multidrug efflux system)
VRHFTLKTARRLAPALALAGLLAACGKKEEAQQAGPPPAVPVAVYKVQAEKVVSSDTYPATVVPLNEVQLLAEVSGYLTDIYVKDGQKVTKGQKLYAIDRTRYAAAVDQGRAQLQVARTNYVRVAKDAERYQRLAAQDAIALQQVDVSKADVANALSQIAAAQASLRSLELDVRHSVITAPLTGTIGIAQVKLGALVSQGQTLINTVSAEDPIAVDVNIGEQDIARFTKLQQAKGVRQDSIFTLQVPGGKAYKMPGKIVTLDRAVDPQTGTLKVRVQFANPQHLLKAGMNATLRVLNQDTGEQLVIPARAVTEQMGEFYVYVVGDSSKVSQRKVVTGTKVKDKTVVRQGLKAGETIVSDGIQNLHEGSKIQVGDPTKPASAQGGAAAPAGK